MGGLMNLVNIDLSWNSNLEIPDLSGLPNLEVLNVSWAQLQCPFCAKTNPGCRTALQPSWWYNLTLRIFDASGCICSPRLPEPGEAGPIQACLMNGSRTETLTMLPIGSAFTFLCDPYQFFTAFPRMVTMEAQNPNLVTFSGSCFDFLLHRLVGLAPAPYLKTLRITDNANYLLCVDAPNLIELDARQPQIIASGGSWTWALPPGLSSAMNDRLCSMTNLSIARLTFNGCVGELQSNDTCIPTFSSPSCLPFLRQISVLDLESNSLQSAASPGPGTKVAFPANATFDKVKHLRLAGCVSGPFPPGLSLSPLETINIYQNTFSTNLPPTILSIKTLHSLKIERNRFASPSLLPVDPPLVFSPTLRVFTISETQIQGPLPSSPNAFATLVHLEALNEAQLVWPLPPFANATLLHTVRFISTGLSGALTFEFEAMKSLTTFTMIGTGEARMSGRFPRSMGTLSQLSTLQLSYNLFSGSILPAFLCNLTQLMVIDLSHNALTGSIPNCARPPNLIHFAAGSNQIKGTLPSLWAGTTFHTLDLRHNDLVGTIPQIYAENFILANNDFSGTLPAAALSGSTIRLQNNRFSGPMPAQSRNSGCSLMDLSRNELTALPSSLKCESIHLSFNQLSGSLSETTILAESVHLDHNNLAGTLPPWAIAVAEIDLSWNRLEGTIPLPHTEFVNTKYVNFAHNNLAGPLPPCYWNTIQYLDLSFNSFFGTFSDAFQCSRSLKRLFLANNHFTSGITRLASLLQLEELSIDGNPLGVPASSLQSLGFISSLTASSCDLDGNISFASMTRTTKLDLTNNNLNLPLALSDLADAYSGRPSLVLSIKGNPNLPKFMSLQGALVTEVQTPLPNHAHCADLVFSSNPLSGFYYDVDLFSYMQCNCDKDWYGLPPRACFACPLAGSCVARSLSIPENYFLYFMPWSPRNTSQQISTTTSSPNNAVVPDSAVPIAAEPCENRFSNCLGLSVTISSVSDFANLTWISLHIQEQCRAGSTGRLCSHCTCDSPQECYFASGKTCVHCLFVFGPAIASVVVLLLSIVLIVLLTAVLRLILVSKRKAPVKEFEELSRLRRAFYRVDLGVSSGYFRILINFLQISAILSNWDMLGVRAWFQVFNADLRGIGISCLFPWLRDPMADLLFSSFLPLILCILIVICSLLANASLRFRCSRKCRPSSHAKNTLSTQSQVASDSDFSINDSFDEGEDSDAIQQRPLLSDADELQVKPSFDMDSDSRPSTVQSLSIDKSYPTAALICTACISITQFLYLATSTNILRPYSKTVQAISNAEYVATIPWMPYQQAAILRVISIPLSTVFIAALPISALFLTWHLRHRLTDRSIDNYVGTLFRKFQTGSYWWFVLDLLRRLVLALVVNVTTSWRSTVVIVVLVAYAFAQIIAFPWKRSWENKMDAMTSLLLMANVAYASSSTSALIFLFVVNILFSCCIVGLILYMSWIEPTSYHLRKLESGSKQQEDSLELDS